LAQGQRPDPLPPLPRILRGEYLWKSAFAPDRDIRLAFLAALRNYLGGPGFLVFSAMAAYPGLNWNLTRALDISLLPGRMNASEREHRLLRLAQLPGCRQGRLPDWLREALQEQLTEGQRERVRKLYHELFAETAGEDEPTIELPLAVPRALPGLPARWRERFGRRGRRLREYLHDLLRGEDQGWEDRIFANLLLGGRMSRLDFVLPRWLNRYLPGWNWLGTARPLVGAIALAILSYLAVQQLWQQWLGEPYRVLLVGEQKAAFSAYTVSLTAAADLNELADSLQTTLVEHGFSPATAAPSSADRSDGINRLRVGPEVPDAVTRYIASRLRYLTYGGPVEIETEPLDGNPLNARRIEISIQTAGRTGSPFRDEFVRELALDERDRFAEGPAAFEVPKAPAKPTTVLRSFSDDLKDGGQAPEMVVLPAGSFEMGCVSGIDCNDDELPVHQVTLPSFAIGRSEVTFADYDRFVEATKRELPDDQGWGRGNRPVINVSWPDARAYAVWLSEQTGQLYRLPSEAEWEYAARAGTRTPYALPAPDGSDQIAGKALANCNECGSQWDNEQTAPVASFAANAWGLHDLHGNVWEWVQDCEVGKVGNYEQAPADGSARGANDKGECSNMVLRGGGWDGGPDNLRSAFRSWNFPGVAGSGVGFRLARTL
jgi:formylglycine-generating enzyme required for sulfatase activity